MTPNSGFDPKIAATTLLREGLTGAFATLMTASGDPYCSLVNVATAADGAPLFLLSTLAIHTKNLLADPRVSLMLDERKAGDPLEGAQRQVVTTTCRQVFKWIPGQRLVQGLIRTTPGDMALLSVWQRARSA